MAMTQDEAQPIREYLFQLRAELEHAIFIQLSGQLTITYETWEKANGGCYTKRIWVEDLVTNRIAYLHELCEIFQRQLDYTQHCPSESELALLRKKLLDELDAEWGRAHPKALLPAKLINPSRYRLTGLFHEMTEPVDPYEYRICTSPADAVELQKKHNSRKSKISVA